MKNNIVPTPIRFTQEKVSTSRRICGIVGAVLILYAMTLFISMSLIHDLSTFVSFCSGDKNECAFFSLVVIAACLIVGIGLGVYSNLGRKVTISHDNDDFIIR